MDIETIRKLSLLSRVEVPENEFKVLTADLSRILEYVSSLQKASRDAGIDMATHRNILRDDGPPHEAGLYSADLISSAPKSENGFIRVDKVIDK